MHRQEAEVLARALEIGLVRVPETVDWAVERISEEPRPHWSLCELATSSNRYPQDVAALLRELPGTFSARAVRRRLLSMMADRLARDHSLAESIASVLHQLASADEIEDMELNSIAWSALDGLDLAHYGTIPQTREQIVQEMVDALGECASKVEPSAG